MFESTSMDDRVWGRLTRQFRSCVKEASAGKAWGPGFLGETMLADWLRDGFRTNTRMRHAVLRDLTRDWNRGLGQLQSSDLRLQIREPRCLEMHGRSAHCRTPCPTSTTCTNPVWIPPLLVNSSHYPPALGYQPTHAYPGEPPAKAIECATGVAQ